jgi:F1F0 ATPase subunit 2
VTVLKVSILIGALLAGLSLGGIFYGGLWLTIRRLSSITLGLRLVGSFLLRTAIVLAGIYFVFAGSWPRLAACLIGFAMARPIVARLMNTNLPVHNAEIGVGHAP